MDFQSLTHKIAENYDDYSPVLQKIADFLVNNSEDVMVMTIQEIADKADVKPSALIRFSKALGFDGFKSMQKVFTDYYRQKRSVYSDRVSRLKDNMVSGQMGTLQDSVVRGMKQLDMILDEINQEQIDAIADVMVRSNQIFLYARGRSEPVMMNMRYALLGLGTNAVVLPADDNLAMSYLRNAREGDCLFMVSFPNYWGPVDEVLFTASDKKMVTVGVTDGVTSPLYKGCQYCLCLRDDAMEFPRTLSGTMVLTESILKSIALRMQ